MDKYTSGAFASTKYGIYKSAQDIITSLPATVIADGQSASAVVKGNMSQSGTPTPSSPIYPSECGDLSSGNYVIPVISGGVTTTIDLSVVQTTRQIKKLVLTGTEVVRSVLESNLESGAYCFVMSYDDIGMNDIINYDAVMREIEYPYYICSHFTMKAAPQTYPNAYNDILSGHIGANTISATGSADTFNRYIIFCLSGISTVADFKAWLAAQYSAGTPITIWYVLATPTTTTLNEPIRKIDTYADSVSVSAIPTTAGSQTFDIDTTLKPSEVDLTYTGWHLYNDKKYTSGAWN